MRSRQARQSSSECEKQVKPSGAFRSNLTAKLRSRGECPGPGQRIVSEPATSPPSFYASLRKSCMVMAPTNNKKAGANVSRR